MISPFSATRWIFPACGATVSTTESSGSTRVRSATRTSNPSRMARVRGSSMDTVAPWPTFAANPDGPIQLLDILPRHPCPRRVRKIAHRVARGKARREDEHAQLLLARRQRPQPSNPARPPGPRTGLGRCPRRHRPPRSPHARAMKRPEPDRPCRLTRGDALSGVSMPWSAALRIRCVRGSPSSSSMLLSISVSSPDRASSIFFPVACAMSYTVRVVALEEGAHGQHTDSHHPLVQLARVALHCCDRFTEFRQASGLKLLHHLRRHHVRDHQLADQIDQPVDFFRGDTDGSGLAGRSAFWFVVSSILFSSAAWSCAPRSRQGERQEQPRLLTALCRRRRQDRSSLRSFSGCAEPDPDLGHVLHKFEDLAQFLFGSVAISIVQAR